MKPTIKTINGVRYRLLGQETIMPGDVFYRIDERGAFDMADKVIFDKKWGNKCAGDRNYTGCAYRPVKPSKKPKGTRVKAVKCWAAIEKSNPIIKIYNLHSTKKGGENYWNNNKRMIPVEIRPLKGKGK